MKEEEIAQAEHEKAVEKEIKQNAENLVTQTTNKTPAKKTIVTEKKTIQKTSAPKKQEVATKAPVQPVLRGLYSCQNGIFVLILPAPELGKISTLVDGNISTIGFRLWEHINIESIHQFHLHF